MLELATLRYVLQSNLVIRNFLVTLKLFLNAKCSLSLWSKLANWSQEMVPWHQFVPYQTVPYHQGWLYNRNWLKIVRHSDISIHRSADFVQVFHSWCNYYGEMWRSSTQSTVHLLLVHFIVWIFSIMLNLLAILI